MLQYLTTFNFGFFKQAALFVAINLCCFISAAVADKVLNVGVSHYPPFQQFDQNGKVYGIDIEILDSVLKHAGYKANYIRMPWPRQIEVGIKNGELDLLLQAKRTKEREGFAYFTDQMYMMVENALFIRKNDAQKFNAITRLNDLIDTPLTIGVARGSAYSEEYEALRHNPKFLARMLALNKDEQNVGMLLSGRIDGFLATDISTLHLLANHPQGHRVKMHMLLETNDKLSRGSMFMFSKASVTSNQVSEINSSLNELLSDGSIAKILARHRQ